MALLKIEWKCYKLLVQFFGKIIFFSFKLCYAVFLTGNLISWVLVLNNLSLVCLDPRTGWLWVYFETKAYLTLVQGRFLTWDSSREPINSWTTYLGCGTIPTVCLGTQRDTLQVVRLVITTHYWDQLTSAYFNWKK